MRQVPKYIVIGDGRMARHMCCYFDYLAVDYCRWYRAKHTLSQLNSLLPAASHVLVLITDQAIDAFLQQPVFAEDQHLTMVHFSGCLISDAAYSAHPLQTFGQATTYSKTQYQQIPFIIEKDGPDFSQLLPGLENPHYPIAKQDKPYYHALCVLANNMSTLFWQKFYDEMTTRFAIRQQDLAPFLQRTFQNIQADPASALTGPMVRGDTKVLQQNLNALQGDPFQAVFKAIIDQVNLGALP